MLLHGRSLKLFHGFVRSKRNKTSLCEREIENSNKFTVEIPFDECGLNKKVFKNFKYLSDLGNGFFTNLFWYFND